MANFKKAKKHFGQNFLRNQRFAKILVDSLELKPTDTVIEIGPGKGMITKLLLQTEALVIAVEVDYDLLADLIRHLAVFPNFKLVNEDILNLDLNSILEKYNVTGEIKICGNLPFNISKAVINRYLRFNSQNTKYKISKMSFITQDEVAKDYTSVPPKSTFISMASKIYSDIKKLHSIPAVQFVPRPEVNGGIILITPKDKENVVGGEDLNKFIKIGFASPRKKLMKNLQNIRLWDNEKLTKAFADLKLSDNTRASEISLETWENLYTELSNS